MSDTAQATWLRLHHHLDVLADHGRPTPCQQDPQPFTSDDPLERKRAAHACVGCPVVDLCRDFAAESSQPFHVWGGIDRAPRSRLRDPGTHPRTPSQPPSGIGPSAHAESNHSTLEEAS